MSFEPIEGLEDDLRMCKATGVIYKKITVIKAPAAAAGTETTDPVDPSFDSPSSQPTSSPVFFADMPAVQKAAVETEYRRLKNETPTRDATAASTALADFAVESPPSQATQPMQALAMPMETPAIVGTRICDRIDGIFANRVAGRWAATGPGTGSTAPVDLAPATSSTGTASVERLSDTVSVDYTRCDEACDSAYSACDFSDSDDNPMDGNSGMSQP